MDFYLFSEAVNLVSTSLPSWWLQTPCCCAHRGFKKKGGGEREVNRKFSHGAWTCKASEAWSNNCAVSSLSHLEAKQRNDGSVKQPRAETSCVSNLLYSVAAFQFEQTGWTSKHLQPHWFILQPHRSDAHLHPTAQCKTNILLLQCWKIFLEKKWLLSQENWQSGTFYK